ncbi:Fc.00g093750.m01.CDS01 [Cosmosporella sp. VM-42]
MRVQVPHLIIASATLLSLCRGFSVITTDDANTLANAIFGQGITILQAQFSGASVSSGTFDGGPFSIRTGAILTSGAASGALPNGDHYVNNGAPGSDTYCNVNTFNAAILTVDFLLDPAYSGVEVQFILASEEEGYDPKLAPFRMSMRSLTALSGSSDPIGIFLGGQQYAKDENGNKITATSRYIAAPIDIEPPDSVTSYPGSTPPLLIDILASGAQTMIISICDQSDAEWDSALLIKAEGCVDCDPNFRLAYVTTTTTVGPGEAEFTSTTKASGTVSGTIRIGVTATTTEETTTTTAEATTTTDETTTATAETTTSTDETITTAQDSATEQTTTSSEESTTLSTAVTETTDIITSTSNSASSSDISTSETTAESTTETRSESTTESVIDTSSDFTTIEFTTTQQSEPPSHSTSTESATAISAGNTTSVDFSTSVSQPTFTSLPSFVSESSDNPSTLQMSLTTNSTASTSPLTTSLSASSTLPLSSSTSTISAPSQAVSNLPRVGQYIYFGCLGSSVGYPSFDLIGSGPNMTTAECIRLATGRLYIGIFDRECFAADTLDSATTVRDGRCDLPCPGDTGLFCGGLVVSDTALARRSEHDQRIVGRDARPGILLTLYTLAEAIPASSSESTALSTTLAENIPSTSPNSAFPLPSSSRTMLSSDGTLGIISSLSVSSTEFPTAEPDVSSSLTSSSFYMGAITTLKLVVTTVVYTIIDPNNPSYLIATELCTTLQYPPCHHCQNQRRPTVEMTTIHTTCDACGYNGDNNVTLTIPKCAVIATERSDLPAPETDGTLQPVAMVPTQRGNSALDIHSTKADTLAREHDAPTRVGAKPTGQYEDHESSLYEHSKPTVAGEKSPQTEVRGHNKEESIADLPSLPPAQSTKAVPEPKPVGIKEGSKLPSVSTAVLPPAHR